MCIRDRVSLVLERLSVIPIASVSLITGTTETLSVRDRDSADSVMSESLEITSVNDIVSNNEMPKALVPETLSVSDIDSNKLIVGLAVVLPVIDIVSDSKISTSLKILSSNEIDSDRKILTVPDKSMPISRDSASSSEISAILEILSVRDIDSVSLIIGAIEVLSVSGIVSEM